MTRFAKLAMAAAVLAAVPAAAAPSKDKDKAASSPKAQRKDLPPGVAEKASEAFARGRELDEAGDLPKALSAYLEASQIYPHPNTTYNIADVYRRMKRYHEAIEAYTKYLTQATAPPDRAAVEELIEQLKATPGQLTIEASGTDETAFVDGEPVGKLPLTLDLREGTHVVDVLTPISYGWMYCSTRMGQKESCKPSPTPRMDGNVVISGPRRLDNKRWRETGAFFMIRERFELRHGHYTLGELAYKQCKPVDIDVPRGEDVVTYFWVGVADERPKGQDECDPVTIKGRTIKF